MNYRYSIGVGAVAAMVILVLACLALAAGDTPQVSFKDGIGNYLVDGKGMTLYYFTKDKGDRNACSGACLEIWPVYYGDQIKAPAGTDPKDLGEYLRADGKKQTTFKNWPLYHFSGDKAPGDTNGQGVKGVWYVVNPISIPSCF